MALRIGDPITLGEAKSQAADIRQRAVDNAVGLVRQSETLPPLYREAIDTALSTGPSSKSQSKIQLGDPIPLGGYTRPIGDFERYVTARFGAGIDRFQALASLAVDDAEGFAAQQREIAQGVQLTAEDQQIMRQISETDSLWEALKLYGTNPRLIAAISSESLGLFAPTLAAAGAAGAATALSGGTAGVPIAAAIVGLGSGTTEYLATIEQAAVERGADPTNAAQMDTLLQDDQFMAQARERGIQRAVPIAAMDALSVGLAGKLFRLSKGAGVAKRSLAATGELGAQSFYGGTGEALAQLNERGEIYAPGEIASEAVGELGTGPVEIGIAALSRPRPEMPNPPSDPDAAPPATDTELARLRATETRPSVPPTPGVAERLLDEMGVTGETQVAPGGLPNVVRPEPIETGQVPAEVSRVPVETQEQAVAEVEQEPVHPVVNWLESQSREQGKGKRATLFKHPVTNTKVSAAVYMKQGLINIAEAAKKQKLIKAKQLPKFSTKVINKQQIADYYEALVEALDTSERQFLGDSLRVALNNPDPQATGEMLQAIEDIITNALDVPTEAFSSPLEPVVVQWRRGINSLEKAVFQPGRKLTNKENRFDSLTAAFQLAKKLFEERANVRLGQDNAELSAADIAVRLDKQPKYLQETGAQLAELSGRVYGSRRDLSVPKMRSIFKAVKEVGDKLSKYGGKTQDAINARKIELAVLQATKRQGQLVEAAPPSIPAPQPRKKSEVVPTNPREFIEQGQAIVEERRWASRAQQSSGQVRNEIVDADQARAPGKLSEEEKAFRKSSKKEDVAVAGIAKEIKELGTRATKQVTTPEGRAAEQERTASRQKPKGFVEAKTEPTGRSLSDFEEEQAARETAARQREAAKPEVRPARFRAMRPLLAALRLGPGKYARLGGAGLVSDLSFFRGMLTGELKEISPEATLAGRFIESLAAQPDGRLLMEEFNSIIDAYVNAPIATEEVPVVKGGIVYPSRTRQVGYRPTGEEPVPAQVYQKRLSAFVQEYARNYKTVGPAVLKYAQSMRTLQNRGFEQGSIVLESPVSVSAYNDTLARHSSGFLQAINRPLRDSLLADGPTTLGGMNDLINQWLSSLPEGASWLRELLTKLEQTGVNIPVTLDSTLANAEDELIGGRYSHRAAGRVIILNPQAADGSVLRVLLHEMIHAVTSYGYDTNARYAMAVDALFNQALNYAEANGIEFYGLKNGKEFLAEGFTNVEFQNFLKSVRDTTVPKWRSLFESLMNAVRRFFGMDEKYTTVLDTLMSQSDQLFLNESDISSTSSRLVRAKALGFDTSRVYYHGTPAGELDQIISGAEVARRQGRELNTLSLDSPNEGIYASPNPHTASAYARYGDRGDRGGDAAVYPVFLKMKNPLRVSAPLWERLTNRKRAKKGLGIASEKRFVGVFMTPERIADLKAQGYDSIVNEITNEIVLFSPDQIRSINAQFLDNTEEGTLLEMRGSGAGVYNRITETAQAGNNWLQEAPSLAQKGNLGFMDLNVMERKYRQLVATGAKALGILTNPLTEIAKAITRSSHAARELEKSFLVLAQKVQNLDNQQRTMLGTAMELVTRAQLNPHKAVNQTTQPWLYEKGQLKNAELVAQARAAYRVLPRDVKRTFKELRALVQEARDARRVSLLKHVLKSRFPEIDETDLEILSTSPTLEDFEAYVSDNDPSADGKSLGADKLNLLAKEVFATGEIPGTYFPLRRIGNWVTSIEADEVADSYFAMHATEAEANADAARLRAEGKEDVNVSPRIRGEYDTVLNNKTIANVMAKIAVDNTIDGDESGKIQAALNRAMAEALSDRILYASQLKRQGTPGAKPSDMLRNVEDYIRSSISTSSQLDTAFEYRQGLYDLSKIQKDEAFQLPADQAAEIQRTVGNIRDELLIRAAEVGTDRDVMLTDRVLGSLGFYTYLGAPSYWILNSTQTAVVGVPVLAGLANTGFIQATRAMVRAYKTLQKATKGQGAAALTGNLDATKAKLTAEQRAVIEQLEIDNVIQATIAHEFNVLTKTGSGTFNKVTNVLTAVPEAIERFNRISMALAAMDAGVTDYTTIKDIVEASQFNYDPANRARLLKYAPEFLGGGARRFIAPMMMFKVFGVNMARLVYGNLFDTLFKKGTDKKQAMKIVGGLVGSHTLIGGAFGGLGLGMNQMIMSVINSLLDDEDEIDPATALDTFLTDHTNEYVARLVTRGLPAAVGVDMSASVNLGNLLFMNRDTDWSEYGGVEQSVYGLLGPVAQYFAGSAREISQMLDGEASVADALEKTVPLKLYRALSQSFRYGMEGLETGQGQQFLSPDELNIGNLATTALGLRPATVSQRQQQFYAQRTYNRTLESKKSELMAEAATANTAAQRRRARKAIREWNAKQRSKRNYGLIITPSSVQRSRSAREATARDYRNQRYTEYNR